MNIPPTTTTTPVTSDRAYLNHLMRSWVTITVDLHLVMPPGCLFIETQSECYTFLSSLSLFTWPYPQRQLRAEEHRLLFSAVNVFQ